MLQPRIAEPNMRAYLQLVRLPNVFTAMADIFLGFLFTHAALEPWPQFVLLLAASSLLYSAGMALNDLFDREQDARERPERPIPSGRISPRQAALVGWTLLAGGVALGWLVSAMAADWRAGVVATLLAASATAYDRVLKRTPVGPLAMGSCRMLNVLLGMSVAEPWQAVHWIAAAGIGVYVVGVTIFARTEAVRSRRWQLALGLAVLLAGMALVASIPHWASGREWPPVEVPGRWYLFWALIGAIIGWRCLMAVVDPNPRAVQMAVRGAIFSLIVLDAGACRAVHDLSWAVVILLLLVPTMTLGRWIYST